MAGCEDIKAWTTDEVRSNREECLLLLQETNLLIMRYIEQRRYYAAIPELARMRSGLAVMQRSREFGDLRQLLCAFSRAEGELAAFAGPAGLKREMDRYGLKAEDVAGLSDGQARKRAVRLLKNALGFAGSGGERARLRPLLSALKSDLPADRVQQEYAPEFPQDLQGLLENADLRFFAPELSKCRSAGRSAAPPPGRGAGPDRRALQDRTGPGQRLAENRFGEPDPEAAERKRPDKEGRTIQLAGLVGGLAAAVLAAYLVFGLGRNTVLETLFLAALRRQDPPAGSAESVSVAEGGLAGSWYWVDLTCSEEVYDQPDRLTLNLYSFQEDGTCERFGQVYEVCGPESEGTLLAFGSSWKVWYSFFDQDLYRLNGTQLLLQTAGAGLPEEAWEDEFYTTRYSCQLDADKLLLREGEGLQVCRRAELDCSSGLDSEELTGQLQQLMTRLSDQSRRLAGSWTSASREDNHIWVSTYRFDEGGWFERMTVGYSNTAYEPAPGESGWYVMPVTHPRSGGTYTYDGEELVLHVLDHDAGEQPEEIRTVRIGEDLTSAIEIDGARWVCHDGSRTMEELCELLGVDHSAQKEGRP